MIGLGILVVVIFLLMYVGVIPGMRQDLGKKTLVTIWGVESAEKLAPAIARAQSLNPTLFIQYEAKNIATYEADLVNALSLGKGPDIIFIKNTWLPKHGNKLVAAPKEMISVAMIDNSFPQVVKDDFVSDNQVFALPLSVDTLALYYNKEILDAANIAFPPKDWHEFIDVVEKTVILDEDMETASGILRAGTALGGSLASQPEVSDVLSALMLQGGTKMTDPANNRASLTRSVDKKKPAEEAVSFYIGFSNPNSPLYTWNDAVGKSVDEFAKGNVAMMFGYSRLESEIKKKNPFLKVTVAPLPQVKDAVNNLNYAGDYWGMAVLRRAGNKNTSWKVVSDLALDETAATRYVTATGSPPALRTLTSKCLNSTNQSLKVFCSQTLSARSWRQPDEAKVKNLMSEMVANITEGRTSLSQALRRLEDSINQISAN